ncbi:MAG: hypothetical protein K0M60_16565 [Hydrogenophaga sp.]|nr:hypothetical protein [Hydrogenophaga sp.]
MRLIGHAGNGHDAIVCDVSFRPQPGRFSLEGARIRAAEQRSSALTIFSASASAFFPSGVPASFSKAFSLLQDILAALGQPRNLDHITLLALPNLGLPFRLQPPLPGLGSIGDMAPGHPGAAQQHGAAGLKEIPQDILPPLEDVEFVLVPRNGADQALITALSDEILSKVGSSSETT